MTDVTAKAGTLVWFGNPNPQMTHEVRDEHGNVTGRVQRAAEHINQSVTRAEMWPGFDDPEFVERTLSTDNDRMLSLTAKALADEHRGYAVGVHELEQIVAVHAAGAKPDWIASTDSVFQAALAAHFGCPEGEPVALLTNGGRDALHLQHLDVGSQPAAFGWGALSANTGSGFAAGDTTLAGEITTASGGLIRGAMTFAHTSGTNTSTLTKTWTANGSDSLPVVVASWANFNASSSGTMGEENALNATATITISGDNVTVTFTLTAG